MAYLLGSDTDARTCFPFSYIGLAPNRFIVRADHQR